MPLAKWVGFESGEGELDLGDEILYSVFFEDYYDRLVRDVLGVGHYC